MCIAAERGWRPRDQMFQRVRTTLVLRRQNGIRRSAGGSASFVNLNTGAREWRSELSSIDTALFLGGVLTVRRCFDAIPTSSALPRRSTGGLISPGCWLALRSCSHGWKPDRDSFPGRWDHYCELMILYLLGIGSPVSPDPSESWHAWSRPVTQFESFTYIGCADPLFVHQFSHAWIDFRGRTDNQAPTGLVREFGDRDAGARGVLSQPVPRVPGLYRKRLGNHRV